MTVDVHGQVDGGEMDVLTHAATEGKGIADVRAGIRYGHDEDEDGVELSVSDDSNSSSSEMHLSAGQNRKAPKKTKKSGSMSGKKPSK